MLPPFIRLYRGQVILVGVATLALLTGNSWGQSSQYRNEPIYSSRTVEGVPLQPFSLRVSYYTPRNVHPTRPPREHETSTSRESNSAHLVVSGDRAVVRHGIAYAPSNAPDQVKNAIWAVNSICNRPYVWGGGHGSFHDYGYDCSGTVSYALHYAGALNQPLASSELTHFGERGRGRWITIYSRHGHTFAVIAGLRLDTTDLRYGGDVGPRWYADGRDTWGFEARHPAML